MIAGLKPNPLLLNRVLTELPRFSYRFANEVELHQGISSVLASIGIEFDHEHVAGPQDRFDFLVSSGIVIEAKTAGSLSAAMSQCARYLGRDDVSVVVLVAARQWGRMAPKYRTRDTGKEIHVIHLKGASF